MKKRWLIIPVAAGLLALLITGGAIFAQGNSHPGGGANVKGLASRVAEILGLEEATVQSAFNQALREEQDAHLEARLARLVEAERLTQDEADTVMQWFQSRPNAAVYFPVISFRGGERLQLKLDRMVEAGVITQEEADQIMAWQEARPDVLPEGGYGRGWRGHGRHGRLDRDGNGGSETSAFRGAPQPFSSSLTAPTIFH